MDEKTIQSVAKQIYRQFPEMNGVKPKVRSRKSAEGLHSKDPASGSPTFILTFQSRVITGTDKILSRSVRVVADLRGKIIKVSTSR